MPRPTILAVCSLAIGIVVRAQAPVQPNAGQAPPVFRAGVDLVQLDVLALDRERRPVRGLTAAEFTITEAGRPQMIDAFTEVAVAMPSTEGAAWTRDIGSDVVSNDVQTRRLVMIVLDDGFTAADRGEPAVTPRVAKRIIGELGPDDLAAVIFTHIGRFQNFTADRTKLLAAVASFLPRNLAGGLPLGCQLRVGGCAINALTRAAQALRDAPAGRKVLFYIGPGVRGNFSDPEAATLPQEVRDMLQALQLANISVYTVDPRGLMTAAPGADDTEIELAGATGGRRIVNTNEPEALVPGMFAENGSYYLLGYRSTNSSTGFRRVEVKVNRPGVTVRTRSGYYATRVKPSGKPAPALIDQALGRGLPTGDLPLQVAVATFAVPGRRQAEVVMVARLQEPATERATPRRVEVVAAAFDSGWKSRGAYRQTMEVTSAASKGASVFEYEVHSRLPLPPGRYEVRVGVESGGRAGSAFVDVNVPDFGKDRLSASSLVLSRAPVVPQAGTNMAASLTSAVPTTVRAFHSTDTVDALVRVYQGGKDRLTPVDVSTRIVDATDRAVRDDRTTLGAEQFSRERAADVRTTLPVGQLAPGQYLLTITMRLGTRAVTRQARFTVR